MDVVHLNVILGTCLDRLGEMKSVSAFIPSDVLLILTWMSSLFPSLFIVKLLQLEYCCSVL